MVGISSGKEEATNQWAEWAVNRRTVGLGGWDLSEVYSK